MMIGTRFVTLFKDCVFLLTLVEIMPIRLAANLVDMADMGVVMTLTPGPFRPDMAPGLSSRSPCTKGERFDLDG